MWFLFGMQYCCILQFLFATLIPFATAVWRQFAENFNVNLLPNNYWVRAVQNIVLLTFLYYNRNTVVIIITTESRWKIYFTQFYTIFLLFSIIEYFSVKYVVLSFQQASVCFYVFHYASITIYIKFILSTWLYSWVMLHVILS